MSNHPIPLISPFQATQASIVHNTEILAPTSGANLPNTGAAKPAASISVGGNIIATDVQTMQASDATTFVYGSTASNKAATTSDYLTVDDTTKLAQQVAVENEVIQKIKREDQNKQNSNKQNSNKEEESDEKKEILNNLKPEEKHYLSNTMMVASHGIV